MLSDYGISLKFLIALGEEIDPPDPHVVSLLLEIITWDNNEMCIRDRYHRRRRRHHYYLSFLLLVFLSSLVTYVNSSCF